MKDYDIDWPMPTEYRLFDPDTGEVIARGFIPSPGQPMKVVNERFKLTIYEPDPDDGAIPQGYKRYTLPFKPNDSEGTLK